MLTRIRNAAVVGKQEVKMPFSKLKLAIARILSQEGYVGAVDRSGAGPQAELKIQLKYEDGQPVIASLKRVSTPGRRSYTGYAGLAQVLSGRGIAIVSTSQGVMTNREARKRRLGGEILCEVF